MPNKAGPRIVQHPLNDASGFVLVAAVIREHGALPFVGHGLRFPREVGGVFGFSVASLKRGSVELNVFELAATRMEIPSFVDGPELVWRKHGLKFLERRNRGPGAVFGVEAVSAAVLGIEQPVIGRDVVVGPSHLHAARAAGFSLFCGGGRNDRPWPGGGFFDVKVSLLAFAGGRIVAAVEPNEHARVAAKAK